MPVTIGDSRPNLSPTGDALAINFDGDKNSGDESRLSRRSCEFEPASGDEFLMLPIESDSSVAELDSSTLQAALSAISEIKKCNQLTFLKNIIYLWSDSLPNVTDFHG